MSDKAKQIERITNASNRSAADMTHDLANLAGSMQDGLSEIKDYYEEKGQLEGGLAVGIVALGVFIADKIIKIKKKKKKSEEAERAIQNKLQQPSSERIEKVQESNSIDPTINGASTEVELNE